MKVSTVVGALAIRLVPSREDGDLADLAAGDGNPLTETTGKGRASERCEHDRGRHHERVSMARDSQRRRLMIADGMLLLAAKHQ